MVFEMFKLRATTPVTVGAGLKAPDHSKATDADCRKRKKILVVLAHGFLIIHTLVMRVGYLSRFDQRKSGEIWFRWHARECPR